jgi:hypothetical protein
MAEKRAAGVVYHHSRAYGVDEKLCMVGVNNGIGREINSYPVWQNFVDDSDALNPDLRE